MKGCLIAVAVVFILVLGTGLLIWSKKDDIITGVSNAMELPDYGKQEYIDANYGEVIRSLDTAAMDATSVFSFGAAVEAMSLPPEVLYIGINQGEEKTEVIKRFEWNGSNFLTMGAYGAGTLSKNDSVKKS